MNFVAIDFETANRLRHSACAIGLAVVEQGQIVHSFYRLIRPRELYVDPFFTTIHGISDQMLTDQPEFNQLWQEIKPLLEQHTLVAHNAAFDMGVLRAVLDAYALPYPELSYTCSCQISRKIWTNQESHRLNALADKFGIDFNHHHAEEDAIVCAKIMLRAAKAMQVKTLDELLQSVKMKPGSLFPGGYQPAGKQKKNSSAQKKMQ